MALTLLPQYTMYTDLLALMWRPSLSQRLFQVYCLCLTLANAILGYSCSKAQATTGDSLSHLQVKLVDRCLDWCRVSSI